MIAPAEVPDGEIDAFVRSSRRRSCPTRATGHPARARSRRRSSVGAGQLRVVVQGDGDEAVLLLHGFGGDADNWQFNLDPRSPRGGA